MPNQGLLTVGEIIEQGCQQGGNPALYQVPAGQSVSWGLKAFRAYLHHVYLTYDLPIMETEGAISISANSEDVSLSALTRYRSINAIYINGVGEIFPENYKTVWKNIQEAKSTTPTQTGIPGQYSASPDRSKLVLYPIPAKAYTGKILYYKIPDVSGYTNATLASALDWEDTLGLVKVMEEFARSWDQSNMAGIAMMIAEKMFGQYRVSSEDAGRANGPVNMKLSSKYFHYKRGD